MKPVGVCVKLAVRQPEQPAVEQQHDDADAQQHADHPRVNAGRRVEALVEDGEATSPGSD